ALTPHTITEAAALRADIAHVRQQGYALSYEDVTIGVAAIGVPLFDHTGRIIGALSLSGITPRWTPAHTSELLSEVRAAGEQISRRMGWQPNENAGARQNFQIGEL